MICLLGGKVSFAFMQNNGRRKMWTPEYLTLPDTVQKMILTDIESEKAAIHQYKMHIKMIQDSSINALLERIIQDEEYHIMLLPEFAAGVSVKAIRGIGQYCYKVFLKEACLYCLSDI